MFFENQRMGTSKHISTWSRVTAHLCTPSRGIISSISCTTHYGRLDQCKRHDELAVAKSIRFLEMEPYISETVSMGRSLDLQDGLRSQSS
jgi:hypothetical protein